MGKITEKAKFIDMYASRPVLSFGKDGKIYSRLGLFLTFLTIVIIGGMTVWIGITIFGRKKPSFIQYELPAKEYNPTLQFNLDDFTFGLGTGFNDYERKRLLRTYGRWFSPAPDYEEIEITQHRCPVEGIPGSARGVEMDCWTQSESSKSKTYLDVRGSWDLRVYHYTCVDPRDDCIPELEAKKQLMEEGRHATFYYEDLLIDPMNFENPISTTQRYLDELIVLPSIGMLASIITLPSNEKLPSTGISIIVEINEVEFTSDNGWIFEDIQTVTRLKPTITSKVSNSEMLDLQFLYGGKKTVYKRTYPKIPDFFAQISGLITILTPILFILVSPYGNLQAIEHMTNEMYEIKLNKSNPNNGNVSPQKSSSSKKKRRSSKSKHLPTSAKGTEGNLLPQKSKAKSKNQVQLPPINSKSIPFAPHSALVIEGVGNSLREDTPPIPEENILPFNFETLEKSPSNPFKSISVTSRYGDESNLISPRKPLIDSAKSYPPKVEDGKLNGTIKAKEEIENQSPAEESESEEEEEEVPLRTSDPLKVPFLGWLKAFWKPSPEVQVLNRAKEHILEAFDLVTLAKKVVEIDKLKACLLTHDQRVIFENLPSSVIVLNPKIDIASPEAIRQYHWKDSFKGDEVALRKSYSRLRETQNQLDQLLIKLYESEYIYDGFRKEKN